MKQKIQDSSKLKQGAFILVLSSALVKIISALFKVPLSSDVCLGDLGFGYFSSAHDVFMPIYFIAVSGFPVAISHLVSDYVARGNYKVAERTFKISKKLILLLSLICFVIYIAAVFPFVNFVDKTGDSIYSFLAVAPSIIFCFWASCYRGYYEGLGNMKPAAVSNIIEALGKLILGLGLALAVIKISGNPAFAAAAAMFGISLGALASAIYLRLKYRKNNYLKNSDIDDSSISNSQIAKKIIIIAIPIVFASLSTSIVAFIDGLTVRYQLSELLTQNPQGLTKMFSDVINEYEAEIGAVLSNEELPTVLYGIRSKAFTFFNLIPTLTMAIGVGLIPAVTESFSKKDNVSLKNNLAAVIKMSALICFPAGLGYFVFGEKVMSLLYGAGASSQFGGEMLKLYGIAAIFAGFSLPLASVLHAVGKQNHAFVNVILGIISKIILNIILCSIESVNIYGSVISTLACFALICILDLVCFLLSVGKIPNVFHNLFKPFFAAVICVGIAYLFGMLSDSSLIILISILLAMVVYFVSLSIFNFFEESDILVLPMGEKLVGIFKKLKIVR